MGIALLTLSSLFQGFAALHRKTARPLDTTRRHSTRTQRLVRPSSRPVITPRPVTSMGPLRPAPLRVVRVCDTHNPSGEMGRLVISGRMADVCAELDRLVAREAAQQVTPRH